MIVIVDRKYTVNRCNVQRTVQKKQWNYSLVVVVEVAAVLVGLFDCSDFGWGCLLKEYSEAGCLCL